MQPLLIVSAFLAMSLASYLDNVRGPILPLLSRRLDLPYSQSSWFFSIGNLAAVVGLFGLLRFSRQVSDRALTLALSAATLLTVGGLYWIRDFTTFLITAAWWGGTIALLGALGNTLMIHGTDLKNRGRFFCGLHMMYGFASLAAPWVVARLSETGVERSAL